jgi:hypothetical protein
VHLGHSELRSAPKNTAAPLCGPGRTSPCELFNPACFWCSSAFKSCIFVVQKEVEQNPLRQQVHTSASLWEVQTAGEHAPIQIIIRLGSAEQGLRTRLCIPHACQQVREQHPVWMHSLRTDHMHCFTCSHGSFRIEFSRLLSLSASVRVGNGNTCALQVSPSLYFSRRNGARALLGRLRGACVWGVCPGRRKPAGEPQDAVRMQTLRGIVWPAIQEARSVYARSLPKKYACH